MITFFKLDFLDTYGVWDTEICVVGKISRSVDRPTLSTLEGLPSREIKFEKTDHPR